MTATQTEQAWLCLRHFNDGDLMIQITDDPGEANTHSTIYFQHRVDSDNNAYQAVLKAGFDLGVRMPGGPDDARHVQDRLIAELKVLDDYRAPGSRRKA